MNERTKQFRVGIMVFAIMMVLSILILWNSDFSGLPFRRTYQVQMLVDQAPGVSENTPVRRHGLPIGRVAKIEDRDNGALITLNIDDGKIIKTNDVPRIQTSLVGDAIIEFVPRPGALNAQPIDVNGPPLVGKYVPSPMDVVLNLQTDLRQTILSLGEAGQEVAELADRLNTVLGANDMQRITRLVESTERAMAQAANVAANFNDIIGDPTFKEQIKSGFAQLPSVISDARAILEALEGAVSSADQNLRNLQGLTGPLGDRGTAIVANLEKSVSNLEVLLAQVAQFTRSINESQGTLGLLIRDRTTYDNLNATMAQANAAIADIRAITGDPSIRAKIRFILDNIATLSDKMARDPARILRGVANRETPIK
jgi:phospholipid/cholesterol/gamma-HCH transport system substrate-binding protein